MVLSTSFSNVSTIDICIESNIDLNLIFDIEYEQQYAEKKAASVTASHSQ